ncbi:NAD-dependent epimerase/dehydratase family protein [Chitinophaga sp. HK235]|uniref:NAD-dependent epimerase/dehydratase family protein n=1 Tax=Chitinophaga sp. HK235 TaxID=2952571 RepID=UPI001BA832C7|nr:NAD-dependent epimerase/dehydratase family protein [Chitinophaga sp. HK235]
MKAKRVFILGTTGYIGGSLAIYLLERGYQVSSLVRKQADVALVQQLGIHATAGILVESPDVQAILGTADIIINVSDSDDPFMVSAILDALEGSGKTFIHTSGGGMIGDKAAGQYAGEVVYTDIPENPLLERAGRVAIDKAVLAAAQRSIRSMVICPTMVYGKGLGLKKESDQIPALIREAQKRKNAVMVGKGVNLTSNVHIMDLLALYELAVEKGTAGSFYYAENGRTSFYAIAERINQVLGFDREITSLSIHEAIKIWSPAMAHFGMGSNILASAEKARKELGWQPVYNNLLEEISL